MLKKFLQAQVKSVDEKGSFEVVASSGKVDRLGDTINPNGWYLKNYKKNPVILWAHSAGGFLSAAVPPVARADKIWVEDEKELKIKGHFADTLFAQELRTLVEGGFLNAVSVGFMPLVETAKGDIEIEGKMYRQIAKSEMKSYNEKGFVEIEGKMYGKGEHFEKQELLEVSWVSVPALPQALVSARKMNLELMTKELEGIDRDKKILENNEKLEKRISDMEKVISDLKETKNPGDTTPKEDIKGRKPFVKPKSKKSDAERLLIMFDKMCEILLKKLRQQNAKEKN